MADDHGPLISGEESRLIEEEERMIRRPGLVKNLVPFFIAAGILYFVLRGQDWEKIRDAIQNCNLGLFLSGVLIYGLGYCLTDWIFNHVMWNRILVRIRFAEVAKVRSASMLVQLILAPLSGIMTLIYMVRKKRVRVLPMLSVTPLLMYCDFWLMALQMAIALAVMPALPAWVYYLFAGLLFGMMLVTWYFAGRGGIKLFPWFYHNQINYALRAAMPRDYMVLLCLRGTWPVCQVLGHYLALRAMGITAPLPVVIVVVMFMTLTTFLPINFLGLGAPNVVALSFVAYAASEVVNAYSLLFQASFSFIRFLVGTLFVYPFWREAIRDHRPGLAHVEREGEKSISSP